MNIQLLRDTIGWGILLWFLGFVLGILLFMVLPQSLIGWVIMPIGTIVTLYILFTKIQARSFHYYFLMAVAWVVIAIVFDYLFLVKAFKPADGYYKLDVYIYYALIFLLPILVGWRKSTSYLH